MVENDQTKSATFKKERGEGFPKLSLPSAVAVMEKASKYGRQWTREQFASFSSKTGSGSAKSGAFLRRVAALRDFGLIQTSGIMIIRTDLTDQIVKPIKPEERQSAIRQAFLNVEIFRTIVETVEHDIDLAKNNIAEMAVKQLGVSRGVKDTFVFSFVESGEFAGLIKEVDKETVQVSLPNPNITQDEKGTEIKSQESFSRAPSNEVSFPATELTLGSMDVGSTSFNARRAGRTWDLVIQVRSSLNINPEVIIKIVKLIQDAEQIAKSLKEMEEKGGTSDNQSKA